MSKRIDKITLSELAEWVRKNLPGITIEIIVRGKEKPKSAEPKPEAEKE